MRASSTQSRRRWRRALAAGGLAAAAAAQAPAREAPLDRVFVRGEGGGVEVVAGRVERNELGRVVVAVGGAQRVLDPARVVRIAWSDAPDAYLAARRDAERGDWALAAARLSIAARESGLRELVAAAAQLECAEALLHAGEREPAYLPEAAREAHAFLAAHPLHADAARARELEARATLLAGQPREAVVLYRAAWRLCDEALEPRRFEPLACARAGIEAARALVEMREADDARALFIELDQELGAWIAAERDASGRARLQALRDEASLGLGLAKLASGEAAAALEFFDGTRALTEGSQSPALRACLDLGRGRALLALGRAREAAESLARVAALDADRDRAALATVLLAECSVRLADADARNQACLRLRAVIERDGGSPAVRRARALAQELGC